VSDDKLVGGINRGQRVRWAHTLARRAERDRRPQMRLIDYICGDGGERLASAVTGRGSALPGASDSGRQSSSRTGLVLMRALLDDDTHWLVGIVTTGADPFTPVSAIEKSRITTSNVVLDWMSVSEIQNHRLSYCTAT